MEKGKTITTTINNKPITLQKSLSIKDVKYLINNVGDNNYKQLFINMLKNKLHTFNGEDIENITSNEAINIINFFLDSSPKLKLMYSNSNEKNIYKRFITNVIKECEESYEYLKNIIENFNNDYFVKLNTTFKITINNAIENINNIVKKLPTIDEINSNIEKYKMWAEYGWVLGFNDININDLKDKVSNQQEADKIIADIYNKVLLNELFKSLHSTTEHEYLLHNAIKDYNDKNYLGCILIISSIIDRMLSENFKPLSPSRRIRAIGKSGITALYQKYSENNDDYSFPEIYILESLKIVLDNFFHDAEDFTFKSKGIINRNLISHGWYDEEITKVDCLKLFHLLCSLQIVIFYKLYN